MRSSPAAFGRDDGGVVTTEGSAARWQRRGEQARSFATQDAFLDAAEALFGEHGVEQTSVTDVAARAQRSIGSLYHHFENKQTLVTAVVDRITGDLAESIDRVVDPGSWRGHSIVELVERYLATSLELSRDRPGYKRITVEVSLIDPTTRETYRRLRRRLDRGLAALLLERRSEIGHPDPETATKFVADQLTAMLAARLDPELSPTLLARSSNAAFVDEVVASVSAYLQLA